MDGRSVGLIIGFRAHEGLQGLQFFDAFLGQFLFRVFQATNGGVVERSNEAHQSAKIVQCFQVLSMRAKRREKE